MAGKAATGFLKLIGLSMGDEEEFVQEEEAVREDYRESIDMRDAREPRKSPPPVRERPYDLSDSDSYAPGSARPSVVRGSNVVQHPSQEAAQQHCVMFYTMSAYADTSFAIDDLLRGRSVHVNLDEVDQGVAQRILDTLSGASYALRGDHRQTAKHSYFFAPQEIQLGDGGDFSRDAQRGGRSVPYRR